MTEPQQKQSIALTELPEAIADWLNSDIVFNALLEIESRFAIKSDKVRVLPLAIGKLVTGALSVTQAPAEVSKGLGCSDEDAKSVLATIKEKILNPVALPLKRIEGIDLSPLPGPMPTEAQTIGSTISAADESSLTGKEEGVLDNLEPLVAGPRSSTIPTAPRPSMQGMETPGLRTMKDVKPPSVESKNPVPIAPKIVATPRPFMLHEEKPTLPNEPASLKINKNFAFDVGETAIRKPAPRPVAAELNTSFDSMLEQKKPATPVTAKTVEVPKVVHYTSMRTPLSADEVPKK